MKKDNLIFISASLILAIILIVTLNKARLQVNYVEENNQGGLLDNLANIESENLEQIEPDDLEQLLSSTKQEQDHSMPATLSANQALSKPEMAIDLTKTYQVILNTDLGKMVIELDTQHTPITSNNFVYLAEQGFYNGTIFHRVIEDFMIQGGDPRGDGTGSPGYRFDDEDFVGEYQRGTVAMANSGPNTNGSQFFIVHQNYQLPKNYVIFGQVIEGLEVLDAIAKAPVEMSLSGERSKPVDPIVLQSVDVINF